MQDQLEKYILSQKDQLDVFEPDDRLWERIDRELHEEEAPVRKLNFWSQSWKVAAAIAMLVSAGALLWWVSLQSPSSEITVAPVNPDQSATPTNPQAFYTAELAEVETYYSEQISAQKARIESFKTQGIVLDEALYEQMDMLNENYVELQTELSIAEDQDLIVNAMIQNLMIQMQILNQQLMILEEIKTKQAKYGKQIQS
ncbi:MAG: anti-sigma factor [Bacteroidota bacterium]